MQKSMSLKILQETSVVVLQTFMYITATLNIK